MKQGKVKIFKLKIYNSEEGNKRNGVQEHSNSVINLIPLMRRITVTNTKITTLRTGHTGITPKLTRGREREEQTSTDQVGLPLQEHGD
jgi:hypothetical protein